MQPKSDLFLQGEAYKNDISQPVVVTLKYPKDDYDKIECQVLFVDNSKPSLVICEDEDIRPFLQIRCEHTPLSTLSIPIFRVETLAMSRNMLYSGYAEYFYEYRSQISFTSSDTLECYFVIPNSPIIDASNSDKRLTWETPFGIAEIIDDDGHNIPAIPEKIYLRPKKFKRIHITAKEVRTDAIHNLVAEISEYLNTLFWFLSFVCGTHVQWHYFEIRLQSSNGFMVVEGYKDLSMYKKYIQSVDESTQYLPINFDLFRESVGAKMIQNYFGDSQHNEIVEIISYLIASLDRSSYFQSSMIFSYTALEMLVHKFTDDEIFSTKSKFKKLESSLRNYLRNQSEVNIKGNELDELIRKLPELKRKSYKTRIDNLFNPILSKMHQQYGEEYKAQSIKSIMNEAIKHRNHFIHRGEIAEDQWKYVAVIRFMVSIWIMERLGYSIDNSISIVRTLDGMALKTLLYKLNTQN